MFGKEEKAKTVAALNNMNQFANGTIISGDLQTEGDIRIDGRINGSVTSKAKVVIGASGVVEGNIFCQNAFVEGRVTGNLNVNDMLILNKTAIVEGDILIRKLVVEEGAKFNGRCQMGISVSKQNEVQDDIHVARPLHAKVS